MKDEFNPSFGLDPDGIKCAGCGFVKNASQFRVKEAQCIVCRKTRCSKQRVEKEQDTPAVLKRREIEEHQMRSRQEEWEL